MLRVNRIIEKRNHLVSFGLDLLYLRDLFRLSSDTNQMKVTVRQLSGRPGINNWHPLLQQLKEIGISKLLIDVKTDNLDDFFQHV
jgi:aryl carrier-like protein